MKSLAITASPLSCILLAGFSLLAPHTPAAGATAFALPTDDLKQTDGQAVEFFENRIRPVLVEHCYECHNQADSALEGGFAADSREAIRRGGESGPAVVPGDLEKSLILKAISYDDSFYQMPPDGKLPPRVIEDFKKWITDGAADPREAVTSTPSPVRTPEAIVAEGRQFWSFVPPGPITPPKSSGSDWGDSPIDRFILAKLESQGLTPAPPASKRELIRRATYDLTGLPPTPREIDEFLADDSRQAFARVIDRLLGSKRYGEKYGRHWLDVVRYADSNGLDENLAYANAFRFRDYVIRAFNADVPFNELIRQHLAGDLLAATSELTEQERNDRLIATGFLSIGPKMLACDDGRKMELDIIDEQLDTTFRSFLGLTMGCARCHDHKFDPLLTSDYYALASVFKSTRTMENFNVVAQWHEYELKTQSRQAEMAAHAAEVQTLNTSLETETQAGRHRLLATHRGMALDYLKAATVAVTRHPLEALDGTRSVGDYVLSLEATAREMLDDVFLIEAENFTTGTLTQDTTNYGQSIGVLLHSGFAEYEIEVKRAGHYQLELRYAALESRPVEITVNGKKLERKVATQTTGGWMPADQKWLVEGGVELSAGKNVLRLERSGPVPHIDKILLAKGLAAADFQKPTSGNPALIPEVLTAWTNFLGAELKVESSIWKVWLEQPALRPQLEQVIVAGFAEALARNADHAGSSSASATSQSDQPDTQPSPLASADAAETAAKKSHFDQVLFELKLHESLETSPAEQLIQRFTAEEQQRIKALQQKLAEKQKQKPIFDRAMGVREGKVENLPIHIRGNYLTLGEPTSRRIPTVFSESDTVSIPEDASGRLEVANWIASPRNPLSARVIANRIWMWHFGKGIVATPDNFGRLGAAPTHPELLDWLANSLVENGWSLKRLHREIMLSQTYQMSSAYSESAFSVDPANDYLWRFSRRRLTAEEIRDSILELSDQLDETIGGQLLPDANRAYVTGTGSKQGSYDFPRRSVYLPILRSAVYPVLQAFDFPDPAVQSGTRQSSTIAPQALFMMNGELVLDASSNLAKSLARQSDLSDETKLQQLFRRAYGRQPDATETQRLMGFLESLRSEQKSQGAESNEEIDAFAWRSVCRIIIASSEFIYID